MSGSALAHTEAAGAVAEIVTVQQAAEGQSKLTALIRHLQRVGATHDQLFPLATDRLMHEYRAGELLLGMERNRGIAGRGRVRSSSERTSYQQALADSGIGHTIANQWQTIARALRIEAVESYCETFEMPGQGLPSTKELYGIARKLERESDIAEQRAGIERGEITLPAGTYDCIDIDPPWPYDDGVSQSPYDPAGHRASNPYPEMSLDDIATLPVAEHAAEDCVVWLWTTHKFMRHAFPILDNWGFTDRAIVTWVKDRMGLGRWLRSQSEFCVMATRGKPTIDLSNQTTIIHGPLREHSRKPDEFYAMVESLTPSVKRLVWFGREPRAGWHVGGNEPERF